MIKVATIEYAGGGCPYQVEGTTEYGQQIYVRYRGGWLKVYVAPKNKNIFDGLIFKKQIGGQFDGIMTGDELIEHTKEIVEWPKEVLQEI